MWLDKEDWILIGKYFGVCVVGIVLIAIVNKSCI